MIFVEAPETEEELRRVGGEIDAWLLANMVPSGKRLRMRLGEAAGHGAFPRDLI